MNDTYLQTKEQNAQFDDKIAVTLSWNRARKEYHGLFCEKPWILLVDIWMLHLYTWPFAKLHFKVARTCPPAHGFDLANKETYCSRKKGPQAPENQNGYKNACHNSENWRASFIYFSTWLLHFGNRLVLYSCSFLLICWSRLQTPCWPFSFCHLRKGQSFTRIK